MRNDSREIAHAKMTIGPISSQQEKELLLRPTALQFSSWPRLLVFNWVAHPYVLLTVEENASKF